MLRSSNESDPEPFASATEQLVSLLCYKTSRTLITLPWQLVSVLQQLV